MPILKRRKKEYTPTAKIHLQYKKNTQRPKKRTSGIKFFSKKPTKSQRRGNNFNLLHLFSYILIPLVAVGLIYISAIAILRMRNSGLDSDYETQYVVGLDDIPTYPYSEFIFQNDLEQASVTNFISAGNSAYRLPPNNRISDVFDYYREELPKRGWTIVLSVDVGSEEMKNGEYWVKDGSGLRIYSKYNDVWYELITEEEALTGLRERVTQEVERNLLLVDQETQDLLPDFSWVLSVPKEYVISYGASSFKNMRGVQFKRLGTEYYLKITPVGDVGGNVYDNFLRTYVESISEDGKNVWNIQNTVLAFTPQGSSLKGVIGSLGENHDVLVVPNSYDATVYVIESSTVGDPFFDFVLSNLQPQRIEKD